MLPPISCFRILHKDVGHSGKTSLHKIRYKDGDQTAKKKGTQPTGQRRKSMMERIHLLIADDHPMVRDDLRDLLSSQSDFEVVGEATNGLEATELTTKLRPDVVLMDLFMPAMDGAAATTRIKAMHPEIHVLVVSIDPRDAAIRRALEAGASSYLLKDAPRQELYRAIRDAARGKLLPAPAVAAPTANRRRDPAEKPSANAKTRHTSQRLMARPTKMVPLTHPPTPRRPRPLNRAPRRERLMARATKRSPLTHPPTPRRPRPLNRVPTSATASPSS